MSAKRSFGSALREHNVTSTPIASRGGSDTPKSFLADESNEIIDDSMTEDPSSEAANQSVEEIAESFAELSARDDDDDDRSRSQLSPLRFATSPGKASPEEKAAAPGTPRRKTESPPARLSYSELKDSYDDERSPTPTPAPRLKIDTSLFSDGEDSALARGLAASDGEDSPVVSLRKAKKPGGTRRRLESSSEEEDDHDISVVVSEGTEEAMEDSSSDDDFIDDDASGATSEDEVVEETKEGVAVAGEASILTISDDESDDESDAPPSKPKTLPQYFSEATRKKDEADLKAAILQAESLDRVVQNTDLDKIPDRGEKLFTTLSLASAKVDDLKRKVAAYPPREEPAAPKMSVKDKIRGGEFAKPLAPTDAEEWAKAPATPKQPQAKGPWVAPPAARMDWNRSLSDGHYGKHLFGGLMTEERLHQAKLVTRQAVENLCGSLQTMPGDADLTEDPGGLKDVTLMRHQAWGLTWMLWRESQSPPGGILADDMGLGKTLAIIALILKARQIAKKEKMPEEEQARKTRVLKREGIRDCAATLVIAPASVANQWDSEIKKRTKYDRLRTLVYHGPGRKRHNVHSLKQYDVVITTYDVIANELGTKATGKAETEELDDGSSVAPPCDSPLLKLAWLRIVLDEAHMIKNYNSRRAKAVFRLRGVHRWALTGTPIHNKLSDLYSLVRFLRCSPLDEISVWKEWVGDEKTKVSSKGRERLNTIVKALILRRTKDQTCTHTQQALVILPEKSFLLHELELKPGERVIYDQLFKASQLHAADYLHGTSEREEQLRAVSAGETSAAALGYRNPFDTKKKRDKDAAAGGGGNFAAMREILLMLLRLRQAAVHLHLVREGVDVSALSLDAPGDPDLAEGISELSMDDETISAMLPDDTELSAADLFRPTWSSTKIDALIHQLRLIKERPGKDKVVIVSQWTSLLSLVEGHLKRSLGEEHLTEITGSIPTNRRQERVDAFNKVGSGPMVMLLSLTAGGVGLNLTGANHLFLLDLHWNPALEQQACDRIYRMGQTKPVFIHKFVCKRTIEIRVKELADGKAELARTVLSGDAAKDLHKLTLKDMRMLFELDATEDTPATGGLFAKQKMARPEPASIYAP